MKKLLLRSCALGAILAFSALGAQAASFDAGVFSDLGDGFTTSGLSGNFLDTYSFTVEDPNLSIKIEGTHEGMAGNDLLLTNVNSGAQYHLGENFSQALNFGGGEYIFTISGFALNGVDGNCLDGTKISDYNLTMSAVPVPAAAWLFGSALLGFVSFSRRRKV